LHAYSAKMQPIVTDVAWSVCLLVTYIWAVLKRLNQSRCPLVCGHQWVQGTVYCVAARDSGKRAILGAGMFRPTGKVYEISGVSYMTAALRPVAVSTAATCLNNASPVRGTRKRLHETPNWSALVKYSRTNPAHCLVILPISWPPSGELTYKHKSPLNFAEQNDIKTRTFKYKHAPMAVVDPGGVQGVQTPALLFRCPFLKRTYFENMSLVVTAFSWTGCFVNTNQEL